MELTLSRALPRIVELAPEADSQSVLDAARRPFQAEGLNMPWYSAFGNHDGLVQGNFPTTLPLNGFATGNLKIISPVGLHPGDLLDRLLADPTGLLSLLALNPGVRLVTPDPDRRLLSRAEVVEEHFTTSGRPVGHGFTDTNRAEGTACYSFDRDGIRFVVLDTVNPNGYADGSLDAAAWQRAVELTLRSAVELTRAVLPGMRERRWGRILHVTSLTVKQPIDGLMLSTSLRSAVTGFSRTLANEVAAEGVTVNTILPGFMNTERVAELNRATAAREGVAVEEVERRLLQQIPLRRIGEPRELAALAVFLASERAAYVTGQSIAVDGGWIRGLM